jgi:hypothetical protein
LALVGHYHVLDEISGCACALLHARLAPRCSEEAASVSVTGEHEIIAITKIAIERHAHGLSRARDESTEVFSILQSAAVKGNR